MLILCQQDGSFPISFQGVPEKIMYKDPRQNQHLAVEKINSTTEDGATQGEIGDAQGELLTPSCDCIRTVKVASVAGRSWSRSSPCASWKALVTFWMEMCGRF
jgi:hypothetical protein